MGIPERTVVGVLALTATVLVVCALFVCREVPEIAQHIEATLKPQVPAAW